MLAESFLGKRFVLSMREDSDLLVFYEASRLLCVTPVKSDPWGERVSRNYRTKAAYSFMQDLLRRRDLRDVRGVNGGGSTGEPELSRATLLSYLVGTCPYPSTCCSWYLPMFSHCI